MQSAVRSLKYCLLPAVYYLLSLQRGQSAKVNESFSHNLIKPAILPLKDFITLGRKYSTFFSEIMTGHSER
jgi:hypothetical protein